MTLVPGAYTAGGDYGAASKPLLSASSKFAAYLRVASVTREPPQIPIDPFLTHHLYRAPHPKEIATNMMGSTRNSIPDSPSKAGEEAGTAVTATVGTAKFKAVRGGSLAAAPFTLRSTRCQSLSASPNLILDQTRTDTPRFLIPNPVVLARLLALAQPQPTNHPSSLLDTPVLTEADEYGAVRLAAAEPGPPTASPAHPRP